MDVHLGRRALVGASADLDAARRAGARDPPASCREWVRDYRSASDEGVVVGAAHWPVHRNAQLAVAVRTAGAVAEALHQAAGRWVVPAEESDEEVVVVRDAQALGLQALREWLAAVLAEQPGPLLELASKVSQQQVLPGPAQALPAG